MASASVSFNIVNGSGSYRMELISCLTNALVPATGGLTNPQDFTGAGVAGDGTKTVSFSLPNIDYTYNQVKFRVYDLSAPSCSDQSGCQDIVLDCAPTGTCTLSAVSVGAVSC